MESAKEKGARISASAKSGMEKTKAGVEEKAKKMTTRDPVKKDMAELKKEEKISEAELKKREEIERAKATGIAIGHGQTTTTGYPANRTQQMPSAVPGHGTREPVGRVGEGVVQSHPVGTTDTTGVGAATTKGYGTGGA